LQAEVVDGPLGWSATPPGVARTSPTWTSVTERFRA